MISAAAPLPRNSSASEVAMRLLPDAVGPEMIMARGIFILRYFKPGVANCQFRPKKTPAFSGRGLGWFALLLSGYHGQDQVGRVGGVVQNNLVRDLAALRPALSRAIGVAVKLREIAG